MMMILFHRTVLLLLSLLASSTEAFSVLSPPARTSAVAATTPLRCPLRIPTTTCLRASAEDEQSSANEEGEETQHQETAQADTTSSSSAAAANDILNSPDFLRRKLEVIQSDLAKAAHRSRGGPTAPGDGKGGMGRPDRRPRHRIPKHSIAHEHAEQHVGRSGHHAGGAPDAGRLGQL